jgi:hypothetical protein
MTLKSRVVLALAILAGLQSFAQDDAKKIVEEALVNKEIAADTSKKKPWKIGGTVAFNLTQQNSNYWIGVTEEFALNLGVNLDLYANRFWERSNWVNTFKGVYAYQNNQTQGKRKTADFFDIYSKYGRAINSKKTLFASVIFNLRSQFADGFDYASDPRRRVSGFFAPANILFTPGIDFQPNKWFSLFFSPVAARWVVVSNDPFSFSTNPPPPGEPPLAEIYGVDPNRKVDAQFGAFLSAKMNKELVKNVSYTSRLDLYSNYLRNPENIKVFWTNMLAFKVNKWLSFSYNWNVAYDHNYRPKGATGPRTQFLGVFGIGVSGRF